jgi:hypothetical protein
MVDIARLRAKALAYRALAKTAGDPVIHRELLSLAEQCEQAAAESERPMQPRAAPSALSA